MRFTSAMVAGLILLAAGVGSAGVVINPRFELNGAGEESLMARPFSDCLGWDAWGNAANVVVVDDHPVARMGAQLGWENGSSTWQNTGFTAVEGEVYRLTASIRSTPGGWLWGANMSFETIDSESSWGNRVQRYCEIRHNTAWQDFSLVLDTAEHPEYVGQRLGIGAAVNDGDTGRMAVTNFRVDIFGGPQRAGNLAPEHNATRVPVGTAFTWDAPTVLAPTSYTLRYTTDPLLVQGGEATGVVEVTDLTTTSYQPASPLENGVDYYWQVLAVPGGTDPNTYETGVNRFTTEYAVPIVVAGPANAAASVGDELVLTARAESVTAPTFKWFRSPDPNSTSPDNDVEVTGAGYTVASELIDPDTNLYETTLTIASVAPGDFAYYYMQVNNTSDQPVVTGVAELIEKLQLAHWPLGGGLGWIDLVGGWNADPNVALWADGVDGTTDGAARIDSSVAGGWGWAVVDPVEGPFDPSSGSNQITISAWIQWDGSGIAGDGPGIVSKRSASGSMRWSLYARQGDNSHSGARYLRFTNYGSGDIWAGPNAFAQGEWVHVVATVNADNQAVVYLNGVEAARDSAWAWGSDVSAPIFIGKAWPFGPVWPGLIDDVQIFNYGMDNIEVADLYFGMLPDADPVCILEYQDALDFDGDCDVDLQDLSRFMQSWLDTGLYGGAQ